jgi:serine/tyrosine/threonine adenylyltransferase
MALNWHFDNTYTRLPDAFFSKLAPTPVKEPRLVVFNRALAQELGLKPDTAGESALAALFSGNALPPQATPIAQAYAGHQFGNFTMLGDGRAIVLGEHIAPDGRRYDIQLKGSGPTPYSRRGDGRAALGPMLREYIISEAMHGLGIPTTRSLAVVTTGESVYREEVLPGAVLTRVASSHLRVGTFEYASARRDLEGLSALVNYAIERHYPDLAGAKTPALSLLSAVMERQADLIVEWMRVGFIHGVMNTDNMTISGESIDYGPCAFMDVYDPATAFSSIDRDRRYAFGNQAAIAQWNLARLAEALLPLLHPDTDEAVVLAKDKIESFSDIYATRWRAMMRRKLGLTEESEENLSLIRDLLDWMHRNGADYTNTFRLLSADLLLDDKKASDQKFIDWHARWRFRLEKSSKLRPTPLSLMQAANPAYIPRNHQVEMVLEAAGKGDLVPLQNLMKVLARPYVERQGLDSYMEPSARADASYRTFCGT